MLRRLLGRRRPGRAELIERKRQLEGEISGLQNELRRMQARGADTAALERRLATAQVRHYETRLEIDRTDLDS